MTTPTTDPLLDAGAPATPFRCRTPGPAGQVVAAAEAVNARRGDENLGFLSATHGFLPRTPPRLALPASHAAWDELAAELPARYRALAVRAGVARLPVLPADERRLPDAALLRAAGVLGILAHAHWYSSVRPPERLPEALAAPWAEVRRRLGRPAAVLSYIDLIVHNWQLVDPTRRPSLRVDNLRLLLPTVDTAEERTFYLTQTEILARATPIVRAVVAAQDAVVADDPGALDAPLAVIAEALRSMTAEALPRINPVASSATHVDPVVWARTVAPFAVPFTPGALGPSGTSSPLFALMDAFLQRRRHDSFLGGEIRALRATYPRHWRDFLGAVDGVSVPDYVEARGGPALRHRLDEVTAAYAGDDGFLGRHRRKVLGYLDTAFKVGRGVTIGGFQGVFESRTWEEIDGELEAARTERPGAGGPVPGWSGASRPGRGLPRATVPVSELVTHNDEASGWWVAVGGRVHDVSAFLPRHPGGHRVLQAYAGLDATAAFARAHNGGAPDRARRRLDVGALAPPPVPPGDPGHAVWRAWVELLFAVVERENAAAAERHLQMAVTVRGEPAGAVSAFKLERAVESFARFLDQTVAPVTERLRVLAELSFGSPPPRSFSATTPATADAAPPDLTAAVARLHDRLPDPDAEPASGAGALAALAPVCRALEVAAAAYLRAVKCALRAGILGFERDGAAALTGERTGLRTAHGDAVAAHTTLRRMVAHALATS